MKIKVIFVYCFFLSLCCNAQSGLISTVAGNGGTGYSGDGGLSTLAAIGGIADISFDDMGNYYFAENNHTIRKVSGSGIISTVAGNGSPGFGGDGGSATAAMFNNPVSMAIDHSGNIYISDKNNNRIRKVTAATGIVTTFAGTGSFGFSGDGGAATTAEFRYVYGVCLDAVGNLYVCDYNNYRIRKIDTNGIVFTVAGNGTFGTGGDGGPATSANLGRISGICFDRLGNLVFTDGSRVRKINTITGVISTIVGNSAAGGSSGDGGPATSALLNLPIDVVCNSIGELFIGDVTGNNVRVVDTFGIIHLVAGTGGTGFSGDGGSASAATVWSTRGVAVDMCDNLYISDNGNYRVRKVTFPFNPHLSLSAVNFAPLSTPVTVTASLINAGYSYSIKWYNKGIYFATTTTPSVTYTKSMSVDSITAHVFGCSDSAWSAVHVVTVCSGDNDGVSVLSGLGGVTCYPNPVGDVLHIETQAPIESVTITNLIGQAVYSGAGEPVVPVQELPAGVYFVKVFFNGGGMAVERFLKR